MAWCHEVEVFRLDIVLIYDKEQPKAATAAGGVRDYVDVDPESWLGFISGGKIVSDGGSPCRLASLKNSHKGGPNAQYSAPNTTPPRCAQWLKRL